MQHKRLYQNVVSFRKAQVVSSNLTAGSKLNALFPNRLQGFFMPVRIATKCKTMPLLATIGLQNGPKTVPEIPGTNKTRTPKELHSANVWRSDGHLRKQRRTRNEARRRSNSIGKAS